MMPKKILEQRCIGITNSNNKCKKFISRKNNPHGYLYCHHHLQNKYTFPFPSDKLNNKIIKKKDHQL